MTVFASVHATAGHAEVPLAFAPGALPAAQSVRVGGLPTQFQPFTFHPDGSVRHGVALLYLPATADYAVEDYPPLVGTPVPRQLPPYGFWLNLPDGRLIYSGPDKGFVVDDWLSGPNVRETRYRSNFYVWDDTIPYAQHAVHPHLHAVFDVRRYSDGHWRVSAALENCEDHPAAGPQIYTLLRVFDGNDGSHLAHEWPNLTHPYKTRARFVGTSYNFPRSRVTPDLAGFHAAGLLPVYNPGIQGSDNTGYAPFSTGSHLDTEQDHGGRPELAPWPAYAARALARPGDHAQWDAVFEHGDLAGGRPVHVREADGSWAVFGNHVSHQLMGSWPSGASGGTTWNPDVAHQPSFGYVAFLMTGERYYAEELSVNAQAVLLMSHVPSRATYDGQTTAFFHAWTEMRAFWGILRCAEAVVALPADWPGRGDLVRAVRANCAWLDWVSVPPHYSPLGVGPHDWRPQNFEPGLEAHAWVAPWEIQYAYVSVYFARRWLGITEGAQFLANFGATLAAVGNDPQYRSQGGFPYVWAVGERNPPGSWNVTFYATAAVAYPGSFVPFEGPGYRLALQAAVAEGVSVAATALAWLNTQGYVAFDRSQRPGWDYELP